MYKTGKILAKILIVEDSTSVLTLIKSVLEEDGYDVICASSGESALELAASSLPDLVLLDIIMPGIDGYETCERIRKIPGAGEIPIVFMSVLDETFNKVKAFESGAVDYVMKPIDTLELLSRVQTHLTIKKLLDELNHRKMDLEETVRLRTAQLTEANVKLKKEISERCQVQESLEQAHGLLEKKVDARTAELKAAKEQAEAASLAKGAFLANMSHEIRTPINGIVGFTYLIRNSKLTSRQREQLNYIDLACQHLLTVINDILDLSKIESGQLRLEKTGFQLSANVHTVVETLTPNSREKKLALNCCIEPDVPENLVGDPTRLRQVLFNLISNAIKFTGAGEVSLKCAVRSRMVNTVTLQFSVTDTGIGLSKEKFDRIFQRFVQADMNTDAQYGGTGLGLSISKQLVELMGGQIWVDSTPGKGSQFNFTVQFPVANESSQASPAMSALGNGADRNTCETVLDPDRIEDTGTAEGDPFHKLQNLPLNILLVEDNEINLKMAANILEKLGQQVTTAKDGVAAVELAQRHTFDMILMDIQMPVMGGIEATRKIREWESDRGRHLPIIAMTAHAMQGDCEKFMKCGMNDYLSKPFDPKMLMKKMQRWHDIIYPSG